MAIVRDPSFNALLKVVYEDDKVYNAKYQNSPVLSAIGKEKWYGGDTIEYAAQYGNGGNFGSVYRTVKNDMTDGVQNVNWKMQQGFVFGLFDIDQPGILQTSERRGAYMSEMANKMAGVFDGLSKTLAMYMYGGKFGVFGKVVTAPASAVTASGNTMTIQHSAAIKMGKGTRFQIMSGETPNANNIGTAVYTVTKKEGDVITFKASVAGETIANGDSIILYTAVAADKTPRGIEGLAELIPSYGDRTGSDWETYITTAFRGIDRSDSVQELAGQFVKAAASGDTRRTDALVELLGNTKDAGGINNLTIVSSRTWNEIGKELGVQGSLWQATNGDGANKQGVTVGINNLATAFGDAFIGRTVIDPYCPEDKAYMLEKEDFKFYDLGNVSKVLNPVSNDQLGKSNIEDVGDQGFGDKLDASLNIDKLFNVSQGEAGDYSDKYVISANIYGNFKLSKTTSSGVANIA